MAKAGNVFFVGSVQCIVVAGPDYEFRPGTNSGAFASVQRLSPGRARLSFAPFVTGATGFSIGLGDPPPTDFPLGEAYVIDAPSPDVEAHCTPFIGSGDTMEVLCSLAGARADLNFSFNLYRTGRG